MKKLIAIIITLGLIVGCNSDTSTTNKRPNANKTQKKARTAKKPTKPKAKNNANNYWVQLQKHLKIDDAKLKQLKAVSNAYTKSRTKLKKDAKGKILPAELTKWRNQKKTALKKVLGDDLYAKKIAYDAKRQKEAKRKKQRAAAAKKK